MYDYHDSDRYPVRKNPRLKQFDYSSQNYYFVTICTHQKECVFGEPNALSALGQIAQNCMDDIVDHFPGVQIDKGVIMPNHVHMIVVLPGNAWTLSTVVGSYKGAVTKKIREICPGMTVWQNSFHDHVIRNQCDYKRIWAYIDTNPMRWSEDCFYQNCGVNKQHR